MSLTTSSILPKLILIFFNELFIFINTFTWIIEILYYVCILLFNVGVLSLLFSLNFSIWCFRIVHLTLCVMFWLGTMIIALKI